jgi:putative MFS transporter
MYGLGWGLVNWGFLTFTPTILLRPGDSICCERKQAALWSALHRLYRRQYSLLSCYGLWSSKKSMILFAMITTGALIAFALVDPGSGDKRRCSCH